MATEEELQFFQDIMGKASYEEITDKAMKSMEKTNVLISEIPGLVHRLKKAVPVTLTVKDSHVFASNPDLDILISGATIDEALAEFKDFFSEDSRHWIEAAPDDLSDDARALKNRYLEYIEA